MSIDTSTTNDDCRNYIIGGACIAALCGVAAFFIPGIRKKIRKKIRISNILCPDYCDYYNNSSDYFDSESEYSFSSNHLSDYSINNSVDRQIERIDNLLSDSINNSSQDQIESNAKYNDDNHELILKTQKEIRMNAPITLRQQFQQKGYAVIQKNLSSTNTTLNEFIELMRQPNLSVLNGCHDPLECECKFRHKYCRYKKYY